MGSANCKSLSTTAIVLVAAWWVARAYGGESTATVSAESVTVEVARDRAQLLHRVYTATLNAMHDHYFQTNRAVLPARAMEDVFSQIADEAKIEARWISVNTPPMSVSHEPRTAFEKQAAEVLASGKSAYEQIDQGTYLRAAPIPLSGGCINCHVGFFKDAGSKSRFAGLVIRIPIQESRTQQSR